MENSQDSSRMLTYTVGAFQASCCLRAEPQAPALTKHQLVCADRPQLCLRLCLPVVPITGCRQTLANGSLPTRVCPSENRFLQDLSQTAPCYHSTRLKENNTQLTVQANAQVPSFPQNPSLGRDVISRDSLDYVDVLQHKWLPYCCTAC